MYILPQVLVSQEFAAQPVALDQPLPALIVGEHFALHRYSNVDEKANIYSGAYDAVQERCILWPARVAGGIVDQSYTRVFLDNALLRYYEDFVGTAPTVKLASTGKNKVHTGDTSAVVFKTANGFTRSTALLRDVQIGDIVRLTGTACGRAEVLNTSVVGFEAEDIPAVVSPAVADASNLSTQTASASASLTAGDNTTDIGIVPHGSAFDGLADGDINETYTIHVVAGGGPGQAVFNVVSASGNDDVAGVVFSDFGSGNPIAIGIRGLTVHFTGTNAFVLGQVFTVAVHQVFTKPVATSGGGFTGARDTGYTVEVVRGGTFAGTLKPQIKVTTTNGIDKSGPTLVTAAATNVAIGTKTTLIQFSGTYLRKGDRYHVPVTADAAGAIRTLVLANNLPDALRGICNEGTQGSSSVATPDLRLELFIKKNIEIPQLTNNVANWTQSDTELCLQPSLTAFDSSWVNDNGDLVALPIDSGSIYIQHRDRLSTYHLLVGQATEVSDVPTVLGVVDPDNPLAFGVYKACLNANGQPVNFTAVYGENDPLTLNDWLASVDTLVGRDDAYGLVPLTQDKDVLDAFAAHCDAESTKENGRWRVCWLNVAAVEVTSIYAPTNHATVLDDPFTAGTQYTMVEVHGGLFLTQGVRPGDQFRTNYSGTDYETYIVDRVLNEESLRLMTGPAAAINVASKFEIHRVLTKTELATDLAKNPGLFGDRRVRLIWPDVVGNAGLTFPGYFLCAGYAGLRSGVLPHQGLTHLELKGFDDLTRTTTFFNATQLNLMAASGYFIVTQDNKTGLVFSRHQLTCGDQSDVNQREDSAISNADHISYTFLNTLKGFIGKGNVTPNMVLMVRGSVISTEQTFLNNVVVERLGPQLLSASIVDLGRDAVFKDRITAHLKCELPAPFNNLDLHLLFS